jgi:N-glycosylase/DNA lyase
MGNQKNKKRQFDNMSYREVQRANSINRSKLHKKEQKWLKENGYKNLGWSNVISLCEKIEEFLEKSKLEDFTLEELFLEADRVGNKYLTTQEIEEFNQKMSQEVNKISEEVDKQFSDTEIEIIDFSNRSRKSSNRRKK